MVMAPVARDDQLGRGEQPPVLQEASEVHKKA
jgi:hypothetical protein